jgi:hypothetical protein
MRILLLFTFWDRLNEMELYIYFNFHASFTKEVYDSLDKGQQTDVIVLDTYLSLQHLLR